MKWCKCYFLLCFGILIFLISPLIVAGESVQYYKKLTVVYSEFRRGLLYVPIELYLVYGQDDEGIPDVYMKLVIDGATGMKPTYQKQTGVFFDNEKLAMLWGDGVNIMSSTIVLYEDVPTGLMEIITKKQ